MAAEKLAGENGLLKNLTRRFYSQALDAEMDSHLDYKKNDNAGDNSGNSRNVYTSKKVSLEDNDTIEVQVSQDHNRTLESVIIPKYGTFHFPSSSIKSLMALFKFSSRRLYSSPSTPVRRKSTVISR